MRIIHLTLVSALLGLGTTGLSAQQEWGLSLEIGMASFSGHATSVAGITPEASGHPSSAHTWGLRLDRSGRKAGFSIGLLIASTGVELENEDAAAELKGVLDLLEISPRISYLIFHPREAEVRLHAGAVLDRWNPEGDETRTVLGGVGGASLQLPVTSRFGVQVRWEATLTGSVFDEDDLPAEFERKTGIGQRWILGARYRL